MSKNIVIIGGGIAAISAIKAIRETDSESEIFLFSNEKVYPYIRIRLSKGIVENLDENKILIQKREWYEQNKVNISLDKKVTALDENSKEVVLEDGSKIKYDKLLIATGSSNRVPPIEGINKKNIFSLRTFDDAVKMRSKIEESKKVVIIGGGVLGLEMALMLHEDGKKVVVLEVLPRLMPNQLDDNASAILKEKVEAHGIDVITSSVIKEITGDEKVQGVLLEDREEIKCDMVIFSTGIMPNIDILKGSNIQCNRGVLVNNKMETNVADIYAAGDVAELNSQIPGLWNIATSQGQVAGYNIVGKEAIYQNITPVTSLNGLDIALFSVGIVDESKSSMALVDENKITKEYKKIFIKDSFIVGAIVIGDIKKSPLLKGAIEKRISLEDVDFSAITVDELFLKLKK
ncbi:NAD(P)/FAD-dependent oxidoreductase [Clostridium cellulovorans]|uniref:FAD-dependent pyridine nucleotide-disulphide oxidoreductase n=1 Tax=Clostridium cellulovorans (strain ATCC 35296 / DSM 3052 / OCM 3 / 743B) TaxID=573061 RepID=D9SVU6_CLOC7|nr:FAD-dependent oxidoreductase [Clostridium cellulovorans]ADL53157.1 FAD-dependent pyridine nucleotide-disulphide oxidoreductase [Clostridium cellulovorans 743B]